MANADKTLLNKDGLEIYPLTRERNVYDENNVNLKEKFKNVVFKDNEVHKFAEELYEESANLFNEKIAIGDANNNTGVFTYTSTGNNLLSVDYMPMKPNTIYSYKTNTSGLWIYEYDSNRKFLGIVDIVSGRSFTSKPNTAYFRVAFWTSYGTTYLNDAIVKEGTNPVYYPYNPNRHITNSEAEFLKGEHDKQSNLLPLENKEYTFETTTQYGWTRISLGQDYTLKTGTYTLDFLMKVASGAGTFNKFSFDYGTTSVFNVGTQSSISTSYSNITRTFTLTNDITYNAIWVQVAKVGTYTFKEVMVNKGTEKAPYHPYNSASHITNGQADFLKSEYEKSLNKIILQDISKTINGLTIKTTNGVITVAGTSTAEFNLILYNDLGLKLETNKQYTFKTFRSGTVTANNTLYLSSGEWSSEITDVLTHATDTYSYTPSSSITLKYLRIYVENGVTYNLTLKPMIVEGNIAPTEFHEGNGETLREKDIKPVLLWKNGNPNVAFDYQENSIPSMVDYEEFDLYYASSISNIAGHQKFSFKNSGNNQQYLFISTDNVNDSGAMETRSRMIVYKNFNSILFREGYKNNVENNEMIIPLELYGRKRSV